MHVETERQKVLYSKHFVTSQKCPYHMTFDLDLEHIVDVGSSADHRVQVWSRSSYLLARRSDFVKLQKCPYHVTFDLDLEHTLDAGPSGDHRVQVWWRSNHVCGRRSDFRVGRKVSVSHDL